MANPSLPANKASRNQGFVTRSGDLLRGKKLVPLPEAETEAKAIARMYGHDRSKVFLGRNAREATFKSLAGGYNVIHLAAHGFLDDTNPLYSYMVLAQGKFNQGEDGLLTAREVLSLKLNANLVVLSACDTALGGVRAGEGMIGMTWAFFVAGVPSTVASQWSVETNSTTRLMVDFHQNLTPQSGASARGDKAEALRKAQLTLLDHERYALPYYWAGFSLVGRPW
jgi:CHAT domain-containing protein